MIAPDMHPTILAATLPHPIGLDRTYRGGQGRIYMTREASAWQDGAIFLSRGAGFRSQPAGHYWIALDLVLLTCNLDIDAPITLAIDAFDAALGVDDKWVGALTVTKILVTDRSCQRLEVHAELHPVQDVAEWQRLSRERFQGLPAAL